MNAIFASELPRRIRRISLSYFPIVVNFPFNHITRYIRSQSVLFIKRDENNIEHQRYTQKKSLQGRLFLILLSVVQLLATDINPGTKSTTDFCRCDDIIRSLRACLCP